MNPPPRSPRFVGNRRPRATRLKDRLDAGALKGTFQELGTPAVTELLGLAGADFVVIDGEHGTFSIDRLEDYVRAGSSSGTAVLYRAASSSDQLARALDTGIAGIVVPRVESGAQAHAVVDAVRFPPVGSRGLGPGRTSGYGVALDELRTSGNDEVLVVAMVETKAGLGAVDEIAQTPGIDAIMIGPADLASSLNVDSGSPQLAEAIERIRDVTLAAGIHASIHCADAGDIERRAHEGYRLLPASIDAAMLFTAAAPLFFQR